MLCKFVILALAAAQDPVPDKDEVEVDVPTPDAGEEVVPEQDQDGDNAPDAAKVPGTNDDAADRQNKVDGHSGQATAVEGQITEDLDEAARLADSADTIDQGKIGNETKDEDDAANVTVATNSTTIAPKGDEDAESKQSSASAPAIFVAALVLFAL